MWQRTENKCDNYFQSDKNCSAVRDRKHDYKNVIRSLIENLFKPCDNICKGIAACSLLSLIVCFEPRMFWPAVWK